MSVDFSSRRAAFRRLHESGCFVIPNPWDIGTAPLSAHLGFKALATTSSGFAFSRGLPDTDWAVPRDAMLAHIAEIVARDRPAGERRFRVRLRARSGGRCRERSALRRDRRRGTVDRGFDRRQGEAALRNRACRRAHPRRARGHRRDGHGRAPRRRAPSATSSAMPIRCGNRSAGSRPMRRRAPTCSTRRARARARTSAPSWRRSRRSR